MVHQPRHRIDLYLVSALFFLSGACAVLDEVALDRLVSLYVGHAATAHAVVVSCFMAW